MDKLDAIINSGITKLSFIKGETVTATLQIIYLGTRVSFPISGFTVTVKMLNADTSTASFTGTVTSGGSGIFTLTITPVQSNLLAAGQNLNFEINIVSGSTTRIIQKPGALAVTAQLFAA